MFQVNEKKDTKKDSVDSLAWPVFLEKMKEEEDNEKTKESFSSYEVYTSTICFRKLQFIVTIPSTKCDFPFSLNSRIVFFKSFFIISKYFLLASISHANHHLVTSKLRVQDQAFYSLLFRASHIY